MPTIRPTTRTPGSLKLIYQTGGLTHRCSVNLLAAVDINDITARRVDAQELATRVQGILTDFSRITSWALYTRPQAGLAAQELYAEGFPTPYVGTHSKQAFYPQWLSFTTTVSGAGTPAASGYSFGQCRLVVYNSNAYVLASGQRTQGVVVDVNTGQLASYLRTSSHLWADFYGQKAIVRGEMPIQFNAHVQRLHGC